jgi:hypothetical protein
LLGFTAFLVWYLCFRWACRSILFQLSGEKNFQAQNCTILVFWTVALSTFRIYFHASRSRETNLLYAHAIYLEINDFCFMLMVLSPIQLYENIISFTDLTSNVLLHAKSNSSLCIYHIWLWYCL